MAAEVFADQELETLRKFPEIGREELFRFFTLTQADVAGLDPGRGRGPADRLGLAVAVCSLQWLGFVPDDVAAAPGAAVVRLAEQLQVDPDAIRSYGRRAKTRTEHLRLAAAYLGSSRDTCKSGNQSILRECRLVRDPCTRGWRCGFSLVSGRR